MFAASRCARARCSRRVRGIIVRRPDAAALRLPHLCSLGSFVAGLLGALTGLGGGVVLIPLLTLGFHVDMRYAIGASLISVIATSSGAAAAYVREGYSNVRIGMFLEVATTFGAVFGAFLATRAPTRALAMIFGVVLIYSAWLSRQTEGRRTAACNRKSMVGQAGNVGGVSGRRARGTNCIQG